MASCVENQCHYVDITVENFCVIELIDKHHLKASERWISIIPSCGFDSLPSDLGTYFAVKEMGKPVKRVQSFHTGKGGISGGTSETMFSMGDLKLGKDEHLVRLHIGLEDPKDLIEDLRKAIKHIKWVLLIFFKTKLP